MPKGLQRQNQLISPRGLRADDAAAYLRMGKTKFLELVDKGTIPRAFTIDSIKIWDRFDLDAVIDAAKEDAPTVNNSFDKIMGLDK
jgi:predicted DNA-binding transcriptional regulator AlpA